MNENSAAAPTNMAYVSRQTVMFVQTPKAIMPLTSLNTAIHAISGNRNGEN